MTDQPLLLWGAFTLFIIAMCERLLVVHHADHDVA